MINRPTPRQIFYKIRNISFKIIYTLSKYKKMLYFNFIEESEGIDHTEGQLKQFESKQCITCRYYFFVDRNFKYQKNICDGCYQCIIYENDNNHLIFRIVIVKRGTFRTVSNYFFNEIEKILENEEINLKKKFRWLYKENFQTIDAKTLADST